MVRMQQEDEHGKMDYQHWLADLELHVPTAFWVDPKPFENKKQGVQLGLCCFLGTRSGKCRFKHQGWRHCVEMQVACSSMYQRCQQLKPGRLKVQADMHSEYTKTTKLYRLKYNAPSLHSPVRPFSLYLCLH